MRPTRAENSMAMRALFRIAGAGPRPRSLRLRLWGQAAVRLPDRVAAERDGQTEDHAEVGAEAEEVGLRDELDDEQHRDGDPRDHVDLRPRHRWVGHGHRG